ncbi:MAG: DNA-binding transcriptional regulator [Planctomycetes bacterium]|nr:DNA-binding transcriptional regulator [Planctomycetota bacterium]
MPRIPKVAVLLETSFGYGRGVLRGIVRYARLHGPWSLYVSPGHFEQELPPMRQWGGSGIIARISSAKLARQIKAAAVPTIALEASFDEFATVNEGLGLSEIRSDSPAIAQMAAEHLIGRGFRQFAYCGIADCLWSRVRRETFSRRIEEAGFTCHVYRHQAARGERELSILARWLGKLPRPVGLMACNDDHARKVALACAAAGLHVPEEVGVVGVDNDDVFCELSDPPLSSVAIDLDTAGYAAAELLDGLMSGRVEGRHEIPVAPIRVVARRSTDVVAQSDPIIAMALRFIHDHAARPIQVADVVRQTDLSRRTLERRFLDTVGRTVLDEITRRRVERAKRLLTETELTVARVAAAAGFVNVKPMVRAFRKFERCTPAKYRSRSMEVIDSPRKDK